MKIKHFIVGILFLLPLISYGQDMYNMAKLNNQCGEIMRISQNIIQLKDSIRKAKIQIETQRKAWEKTCLEYLNSTNQTAEDFQYLIQHTDSVQEKGLYDKLVAAKSKANLTPHRSFTLEPVETIQPIASPKQEPIVTNEKKDSSKNDNEKQEKKKVENKKENKKIENKKEPSTKTSVEIKDEDLGGSDMKENIGNK